MFAAYSRCLSITYVALTLYILIRRLGLRATCTARQGHCQSTRFGPGWPPSVTGKCDQPVVKCQFGRCPLDSLDDNAKLTDGADGLITGPRGRCLSCFASSCHNITCNRPPTASRDGHGLCLSAPPSLFSGQASSSLRGSAARQPSPAIKSTHR